MEQAQQLASSLLTALADADTGTAAEADATLQRGLATPAGVQAHLEIAAVHNVPAILAHITVCFPMAPTGPS
jgi:hypothetical protein